MTKLSDRLRPYVEAEPWVIDGVRKMEAEINRLRAERDDVRADAERYRFHRAREVAKAHELGLPNYTNEMFDAYTDAEGK